MILGILCGMPKGTRKRQDEYYKSCAATVVLGLKLRKKCYIYS